MKLPLTLAIIDGLVVGVGTERYIVPIFAVREMLRPEEGTISTMHGREEMAMVRDRCCRCAAAPPFGVQPRSEKAGGEPADCFRERKARQFCLMVDRTDRQAGSGDQEPGRDVQNIVGVAGGAILGDGRVGLILDVDPALRRLTRDPEKTRSMMRR